MCDRFVVHISKLHILHLDVMLGEQRSILYSVLRGIIFNTLHGTMLVGFCAHRCRQPYHWAGTGKTVNPFENPCSSICKNQAYWFYNGCMGSMSFQPTLPSILFRQSGQHLYSLTHSPGRCAYRNQHSDDGVKKIRVVHVRNVPWNCQCGWDREKEQCSMSTCVSQLISRPQITEADA